MAGLEKLSLGDGRGEVKGELMLDALFRLKDAGMNPGGTRGLTPRRGEEFAEGPFGRGICHEAGDALRRTVWRIKGGEELFVELSRWRQRISSIAFSKLPPVRLVSFFRSSSSLSVLSSSSMVESRRMGRQSSYVSSDTMVPGRS
jgi:hypothetical protein